jgi:hypothetical protein
VIVVHMSRPRGPLVRLVGPAAGRRLSVLFAQGLNKLKKRGLPLPIGGRPLPEARPAEHVRFDDCNDAPVGKQNGSPRLSRCGVRLSEDILGASFVYSYWVGLTTSWNARSLHRGLFKAVR